MDKGQVDEQARAGRRVMRGRMGELWAEGRVVGVWVSGRERPRASVVTSG